MPAGAPEVLVKELRDFSRQALHAVQLELSHPVSHETMSWRSDLPDDMQHLINTLEQYATGDN